MSKDLAELPKGWKVVRLGDVCRVKTSFPSFNTIQNLDTKDAEDETVLALKVSDMNNPKNQRYIVKAQQQFQYPLSEIITKKFLLPNSLIFPKRGAAIATNKKRLTKYYCILDPNLIGIEASESVDGEYLFGFFEKFDLRVLQDNNPIPQLNKHNVEGVQFTLPPLEEQRAIATTLRTIQTSKEARQKELALERERKAALMDYLFTHGTRNEPRKQTELGEIPESWKISKFGQLVEMKNGINFKTEQKGKGILTIDVFNMYSDSIYLVMNKLYRVDVPDIKEHFLLQPNDILFVRSSLKEEGVGWASLFKGFEELVTFCGFIIRARLMTNEFIAEYLLNYLRLPSTRRFIVSKSDKVAITNINQGGLSSLPVLQPSKEEQQEIADILSSCDAKIATLEREINLHDELFRAMLEKLMTGQISSLPLVSLET